MEEWVDIKGYEGRYQISNKGVIKGVNGRLITIYKTRSPFVFLMTENRVRSSKQVIRLVAEHFIPNPNNYSYVELKNPNIDNLSISNIRWVSKPQKRKNNVVKQITPGKNSLVNWKPLFEGYDISDWGQIKMLPCIKRGRNYSEKILTNQYYQGSISVQIKGITYSVKKLVAEKFLGPSRDPEKIYVNCIDGNPYNLHISNLEWVTKSFIHTRDKQKESPIIEDLNGQIKSLASVYNKKELSEIYELPLEQVEELLAS